MKIMTTLLCIFTALSVHAQKPTKIEFSVQDKTFEPIQFSCEEVDTTLALTTDGKAELTMNLTEPKYAVVRYKFKTSTIYIEPKKPLKVSWDMTPSALVIAFEGKSAPKNNLINTRELQGPVMGDFGKQEEDLLETLDDYEAKDFDILKSKKFDKTFVEKDKQRIKYWINGMLGQYASTRVCSEDVYSRLEALTSQDEWLMQLSSYTNFMISAVTVLANRGTAASEVEPLKRTLNNLNYVLQHFTSKPIKEFLIGTYAIEHVVNSGVKGAEPIKDIVEKHVTDSEILAAFGEAYAKAATTSEGVLSPDFTMVDMEGKEYNLASFKGCIMYIDLWATWCGPCKAEIPHLKKLAEMFQGSNIRFVSMSIDKDKAKWEAFLKAKEGAEPKNCVQLYAGDKHKWLDDYEVNGIPRFIILDKEGRIVDANAPRPSEDKIIEILGNMAEGDVE